VRLLAIQHAALPAERVAEAIVHVTGTELKAMTW
jgi:hypothetical protein